MLTASGSTSILDREVEPVPHDGAFTDDGFTDEELTELALAADIDQPLAEDAVPFDQMRSEFGDLLPDWYMPAPASRRGGRRHGIVATVIVLSLLAVNAVGLCVTYGSLEIAW